MHLQLPDRICYPTGGAPGLVCVGGLQAEDYGHVEPGFDGLAAKRSRFITPLSNSICSGGFEERRAGHLVDVLDVAVAVDDHVQLDGTFDALALCVFGVYRFDARNQLAQLQAGALLGYLRLHLGRNADRRKRTRAD
jgi:hypothetical protein